MPRRHKGWSAQRHALAQPRPCHGVNAVGLWRVTRLITTTPSWLTTSTSFWVVGWWCMMTWLITLRKLLVNHLLPAEGTAPTHSRARSPQVVRTRKTKMSLQSWQKYFTSQRRKTREKMLSDERSQWDRLWPRPQSRMQGGAKQCYWLHKWPQGWIHKDYIVLPFDLHHCSSDPGQSGWRLLSLVFLHYLFDSLATVGRRRVPQ